MMLITEVILSIYGDAVGVSMMAAAGIALFLNYFLRRLLYKENAQKDEMTKRISSITSEFAFLTMKILGIFMLIKSYSKWKRWKDSDIHTDEALTDERSELNLLRVSKAGFMFLYGSIAVLFTLLGLRLINEIIFTALMGPVFAVASVFYVLLFYRYEKGVNENEN
jgi:MFS family permease